MPKPGPDIEALREAYQRSLGASAPDECPTDERLADLVLGELAGEARNDAADHVVRCSRCRESYRVLRELHSRAETAASRRPWWGAPALRIAAGALVVVGASLLLRSFFPFSSPENPVTQRSVRDEVTPTDQANLAAVPSLFEWPAQVGATRYRVRLFDVDAELVRELGEVEEPRLVVPEDARFGLRGNSSYFWTVEVQGAVQRTRLGPFWFHLE